MFRQTHVTSGQIQNLKNKLTFLCLKIFNSTFNNFINVSIKPEIQKRELKTVSEIYPENVKLCLQSKSCGMRSYEVS